MPSPREIAKKHASLPGEPTDYCGQCGLPSKDCQCASYFATGEKKGSGSTSSSEKKED